MADPHEYEEVRYSLREVTEADREILWCLHKATMREYVDRTWGWDESFQRGMFDENFDPKRQRIVTVGGEDVGVISVDRRGNVLDLYNLRILPAYQGRGLGTLVVRDVLAAARRQGLAIHLSVLKANPRARRLYERLGFIITGESETHYMMTADASSASNIAHHRPPS